MCWENLLEFDDPLSKFNELLVKKFNENFPLRKIKKKKKKQWVSLGIKTSATNLRCLHTIRKFTKNNTFHIYFNKYRSTYRKVIKTAKKSYFKNKFSCFRNDSKRQWSIVNELRGGPKSSVRHVGVAPNMLNKFYCSVADDLLSEIQPSADPMSFLRISIADSFGMHHTDIVELKSIIRSIANKHSSGVDELNIKVFECLPDHCLSILASAINISFDNGTFPNCLKLAVVKPLSKGGDPDDPANFRPISLLPVLSKIIEKIVKERMICFLNRHNILLGCQFGFQKNKCTVDAVFNFLEDLYLKLNDGDVAAAVFCDFSKAFDCVNHEILLKKMEMYGFRGVPLRWFSSFLTNRKQLVRSQGITSGALDISHGVPQGSVLGPLLFLLYVNDLPTIGIQGKFTLFADDTTILWVGRDSDAVMEMVSHDVEILQRWCDSNLLSLNVNKTKILTFKFNLPPVSGCPFDSISSTKFLGLWIDNRLKFKEHILTLSSKLASGCYALRVVANELGGSIARDVYFCFVESHIRYGIAFWGFCGRCLFDSIFILQKRAIRYVARAKVRDHCRPLFKKLKILTLPCIFILEAASLIYKKNFGIQQVRSYNTRRGDDIPLPIPKSALTRDSLIYEGIKIYNHLPGTLRGAVNLKMFRNSLKKMLLEKAFYSVVEFFEDGL